MNYIVNNEKLIIQYIPGNGAWTYQLIVPNKRDKRKMGRFKSICKRHKIKKNLGPMKNSDKKWP
jgi:hypothetical protein